MRFYGEKLNKLRREHEPRPLSWKAIGEAAGGYSASVAWSWGPPKLSEPSDPNVAKRLEMFFGLKEGELTTSLPKPKEEMERYDEAIDNAPPIQPIPVTPDLQHANFRTEDITLVQFFQRLPPVEQGKILSQVVLQATGGGIGKDPVNPTSPTPTAAPSPVDSLTQGGSTMPPQSIAAPTSGYAKPDTTPIREALKIIAQK